MSEQSIRTTFELSAETNKKSLNVKSYLTRKRKGSQNVESDIFQCTIKPDPDSQLPDSHTFVKVVPPSESAETNTLFETCLDNSAKDIEVMKTEKERPSLRHSDLHAANSTESNAKQSSQLVKNNKLLKTCLDDSGTNIEGITTKRKRLSLLPSYSHTAHGTESTAKQNSQLVKSDIFQCILKPDPDSLPPDSETLEKALPKSELVKNNKLLQTCLDNSTTDFYVITEKEIPYLFPEDSQTVNSTESISKQNDSDIFQCTIKLDPDSIPTDSDTLEKLGPTQISYFETSKSSEACLNDSTTDSNVITTKRKIPCLLPQNCQTANSTESNAKQNSHSTETDISQCIIKPDPDSILPDSDTDDDSHTLEKLVTTQNSYLQTSALPETCLNDSTTNSNAITNKREIPCLFPRDSQNANSPESNAKQNPQPTETDIFQCTIKPDPDSIPSDSETDDSDTEDSDTDASDTDDSYTLEKLVPTQTYYLQTSKLSETCVNDPTDFEVTTTPTGKTILSHRGFSYKPYNYKLLNTIDNVIMWKCFRAPYCPGMLKLKHQTIILSQKAHSCTQNSLEVMKDFEIINLKNGKSSLLKYGRYRYRSLIQELKRKTSNWVCVNEKKSKCEGTLKIQDNIILSRTEHSCKPDISGKCKRVLQLMANCCKRAREDVSKPVNEIYEEEVKNLYETQNNQSIPEFEKIKERLHNIRESSLASQMQQQSTLDISMTKRSEWLNFQSWKHLPDGSPFLVINNSDSDIMVFAAAKARGTLICSTSFVVDDTFDFCCPRFEQLVTIHAEFCGQKNNIETTPVFYALLPDLKVSTYEQMLILVRTWSGGYWDPLEVTLDVSSAGFCAFQKVFPSAYISPCSYGFNRQLWNKVKSLKLADIYKEHQQIRSLLNMCAALSNIPPSLIGHGWQVIMDVSPDDELLSKFYEYFAEQWLENCIVPMEVWNVHGLTQHTNNPVEWWHLRLSQAIGPRTPTLKKLVKNLKEDAQAANISQTKPEKVCPWREVKLENGKINNKIRKILEKYNKNKNLRQCLKDIASTKDLEQFEFSR